MNKLIFAAAIVAALMLSTGCRKKSQPAPPPAAPKSSSVESLVAPPAEIPPTAEANAKTEVAPGSIKYLDARSGFRDLVFGQSRSNVANLVLKSQDEAKHLETFIRQNEEMKISGLPAKSIEYTFFNDQLFKVEVKWRVEQFNLTKSPSAGLVQSCSTLYGTPQRRATKKDGMEYTWRGRQTNLVISEARLPGVPNVPGDGWSEPPTVAGFMIMESLELGKEMKVARANALEERKDGL